MKQSKRKFIKNLGLGFLSLPFFKGVRADYKPKVIIIGGGFGGATCLRYLERYSDNIEIILIEREKNYYTCPFSNYVLGDFRNIEKNRFFFKNYDQSRIKILYEEVKFVDSEKKKIVFQDKKSSLFYDYLILSPGISYKWGKIEGYGISENTKYPHGWSGKDANLIRRKVNSLENNCKIIISVPEYPYRCPPAPYERASMIAYNLKNKGLKFKIIILDSKNKFTKQKLFFNAWEKLYPNSINWISKDSGGEVIKLDSMNKILYTRSGEKYKGDLINIIPDQKASEIIFNSRLSLDDWCSINPSTFELKDNKFIYVIGDSIDAGDMPKSAFSANSQALVCAENIINRISGKKIQNPVFLNTCYSLAAPKYGFSVSSWYRVNNFNTRIVSLGSKETPIWANSEQRKNEVNQSYGWYNQLTKELFG